ncbi:MAG: SH3 domain-containing protein, partial [Bacteroidota bacterium]
LSYLAARPQDVYRYIVAPSGLNMRQGPSLGDEVVAKLPYGCRVEILDSTGVTTRLKDQGRWIEGEWLKVTFDSFVNAEAEGFAYGPFLGKEITQIPPHSLYYVWSVQRYSMSEGQTDDYQVADYRYEISWQSYPSEGDQGSRWGVPAVYEPNDETPVLTQSPYLAPSKQTISEQALQDSIQNYLELRLLGQSEAKQMRSAAIANPYQILPIPKPTNLSEIAWRNDFLLPIREGKDSIRITDYDGEGYISKRFVGTLEKLGKYVVNEAYETPSHIFYDRQTGKRRFFTEGLPLISPDGAWVIDLYDAFMDGGCVMTLSGLDSNFDRKEVFQAFFLSWSPKSGLDSFFWTSNRELCVKVTPVTQSSMYRSMVGLDPIDISSDAYQWLSIRIK